MSELYDLTQTPPARVTTPEERALPWDHWSKGRRQWTALGTAAAVLLLGALAGGLSLLG